MLNEKFLGGGQYGQVYEGRIKRTNEKVAIKRIDMVRMEKKGIRDEDIFQEANI